jgi:hypothetical protein
MRREGPGRIFKGRPRSPPRQTRFLTQDVIETTWQAGASVRFTLDSGVDVDGQWQRGLGSLTAGLDAT